MQISLFCVLTLSTLFYGQTLELTATPTPIPGSGTPTPVEALIVGSIDSTLGLPHLPEGFDLTYEIGGPKLRVTPCLMNAVAALKELALGEWDRRIIDGTEYRLDGYPEVSIIVTTPKRNRSVQAKFVTWAVCYGMYQMIWEKKFEFAQFEMSWQGQKLGWVQIVNHSPNPGLSEEERQSYATLHLGNNSAASPNTNGLTNITNVVTPENVNDPADARLNVTFEPYGDTVGIYDVFVSVMRGLSDMGKIPDDSESSGLMISLHGFNIFICFTPVLPLRTRLPTLNYGWLIRTVARIPTYMLGKGRFGEVTINVAVDEVNVGYGRLSTLPTCHVDGLLPASFAVEES